MRMVETSDALTGSRLQPEQTANGLSVGVAAAYRHRWPVEELADHCCRSGFYRGQLLSVQARPSAESVHVSTPDGFRLRVQQRDGVGRAPFLDPAHEVIDLGLQLPA